jgi:hypothetical protein
MAERHRIDCRKCSFFYITWDKKFPYGCKAMGFKTHLMPSMEVRQASGVECLRFEPKTDRRAQIGK